MKRRFMWQVTTVHGDSWFVYSKDRCHNPGATFKRVLVLSSNH